MGYGLCIWLHSYLSIYSNIRSTGDCRFAKYGYLSAPTTGTNLILTFHGDHLTRQQPSAGHGHHDIRISVVYLGLFVMLYFILHNELCRLWKLCLTP